MCVNVCVIEQSINFFIAMPVRRYIYIYLASPVAQVFSIRRIKLLSA